MKKKSALLSLLLLFSLLLALGGCSSTESSVSDDSTEETTSTTSSSDEKIYSDFSWDDKDPFDYVTLGEYENIVYTAETVTVSEDDVMYIIELMLAYSSSYEQITEGIVEDGDTVCIDYVGTMDGEEFSGGTASGQIATIGVSSYIDGFLDGLIGAEIGSTVTLELQFPEDYQNSDYAGLDVTFEVTIQYVQGEEIVPEFTDEWVAEYTSSDFSTTDDLYNYIYEQLLYEEQETAASNNQALVWSLVVQNATLIEYPEGLTDFYYNDQRNLLIDYASYYSMTYTEYIEALGYTAEEVDEILVEYAAECALSATVNRALAIIYDIELTEEEYDEYVQELADYYGYEDLDQLVEDAGGKIQIEDSLLYAKVIVEIMKTAVAEYEEEEATETETEAENVAETDEETADSSVAEESETESAS